MSTSSICMILISFQPTRSLPVPSVASSQARDMTSSPDQETPTQISTIPRKAFEIDARIKLLAAYMVSRAIPRLLNLQSPIHHRIPHQYIMSSNTNTSWHNEPPYQIQPPDQFGPVHWTARCQCGLITYKINRERPLDAKYCHCRTCQALHGAPFQWAAILPKSSISFDNGVRGLTFFDSAHRTKEHHLPCKVSCEHCRSPIMDEGRNMALVFPTLVNFGGKGREGWEPRYVLLSIDLFPFCGGWGEKWVRVIVG